MFEAEQSTSPQIKPLSTLAKKIYKLLKSSEKELSAREIRDQLKVTKLQKVIDQLKILVKRGYILKDIKKTGTTRQSLYKAKNIQERKNANPRTG